MFASLIDKIKRLINKTNIVSFTYYIPAPPPRTSGYREREFDRLIYSLQERGCEIISIQTSPNTSTTQTGMWIIAVLKLPKEFSRTTFLDFPSIEDNDFNKTIQLDEDFTVIHE